MEKILEKLHSTLSETKTLSDAGNLEPLISFICDVASTFFSSVQDCLLLLSAEELLLTVFQLTAQDQMHTHLSGRHLHRYSIKYMFLSSKLSSSFMFFNFCKDSVLEKLMKVCLAGVQSLIRHSAYEVKDGGFLHSAAIWVKNQLLGTCMDIKR